MKINRKILSIERKKGTMSDEEYTKQYSNIIQKKQIVWSILNEKEEMLSRATSENFDYSFLKDQKLIAMGIPATIESNKPATFIKTDLGAFPKIEFKSQAELDAEYTKYVNQIDEAVKKGETDTKKANEIKER